jgi:predicted transposase YdaD
VIQLVLEKPDQIQKLVKDLVATAKEQQEILKLIETVLVYKFPKLTRQEIEAMFTLSDLKQTRVYQDALLEGKQEGRQEGEQQKAQSLVLRLLTRRLGKLDGRYTKAIEKLEIAQLDELAEALLDFVNISELDRWLESQRSFQTIE